MSDYFQKTANDRCLILATGEAYRQPLGAFCNGWTSLQIGMYLSITGADAGDDAFNEVESVAPTNPDPTNSAAIGLATSSQQALPHQDGCTFFGLFHSYCSTRVTRLRHYPGNNDPALDPALSLGTDQTRSLAVGVVHGATTADRFGSQYPEFLDNAGALFLPRAVESTAPENYCAFAGLRFTLQQRGTGNQRLDVGVAAYATHRQSDPTLDATRARLHGVDWSQGQVTGLRATDDGGAPVPIPDAVLIRWPLFESRLRLHSLVVERLA